MALQPAWRSLGYPVADAEVPASLAPFYRLYLLQADDHIARRREDYFADDAAAIGAARNVIGDFHGVEIWCGPRKVVTLLREQVARLPTALRPVRAAILISRNKRLLLQARGQRVAAPRHCARARWRGGVASGRHRLGSTPRRCGRSVRGDWRQSRQADRRMDRRQRPLVRQLRDRQQRGNRDAGG